MRRQGHSAAFRVVFAACGFIMLALMTLAVRGVSASAYAASDATGALADVVTPAESDFITTSIGDGSAVAITGYSGTETAIRLPAQIGGKPVAEAQLSGLGLRAIDASGCTFLASLCANMNELAAVNVDGCADLARLELSENKLAGIDVSGNTKLGYLYVDDNALVGTLDLSHNTQFQLVRCCFNHLTSLVLNSSSLRYVNCSDNWLDSLITNAETVLEYLDCGNNRISMLDLSANTALTELHCGNQSDANVSGTGGSSGTQGSASGVPLLGALDLTHNTGLKRLDCQDNALCQLEVGMLADLEELNCRNNRLVSLDVRGLANLVYLNCAYNGLAMLDVEGCAQLGTLLANQNQLTDISGLAGVGSALKVLLVSRNKLAALDISSNTALTRLECASNEGISSLALGNLPELAVLNISLTGIAEGSTLSLASNTKLEVLYCSNLGARTVSLSECTSLKRVYMEQCANLTRVTMPESCPLESFDSNGCPLGSLALPAPPSSGATLRELRCDAPAATDEERTDGGHGLAQLDLSGQTALVTLSCANNDLRNLDLSPCQSLMSLDVSGTYLNFGGCVESGVLVYLDGGGNSALDGVVSLGVREDDISDYDLGLDLFPNLVSLNCSSNSRYLKKLDLSPCTKLERVDCRYCAKLTSISGLGENPGLAYIACPKLEQLDEGSRAALGEWGSVEGHELVLEADAQADTDDAVILGASSVASPTAASGLDAGSGASPSGGGSAPAHAREQATTLKAASASADANGRYVKSGNFYYYTVTDSGGATYAVIIGYVGTESNSAVHVSSYVDGYPVRKVNLYYNGVEQAIDEQNKRGSKVRLTSLVFSGGEEGESQIQYLDCSGNSLKHEQRFGEQAGLSRLAQLKCRNAFGAGESAFSLDVSDCGCLTSLNCSGNEISALRLGSTVQGLQSLDCSSNALEAITLTGAGALAQLACHYNPPLKTLVLPDPASSALSYLSWYGTGVEAGTLDLTAFTKLVTNLIAAPEPVDIRDAEVSVAADSYAWSGSAVEPEVSVRLDNEQLTPGYDYIVTYADNTSPGTATVRVTGIRGYTGSVATTFRIDGGRDISAADVTLDQEVFAYDGRAKEPRVTVRYGDDVLSENADYTVTYADNVQVGTATVTVSGAGGYVGAVQKTFVIEKASESPGEDQEDGGTGEKPSSEKAANSITVVTPRTITARVDRAQSLKLGATAKAGALSYAVKSNAAYAKVSSAGKVTIAKNFTGTVKIEITVPATAAYTAASKAVVIRVKPAKMAIRKAVNIKGRKIKVSWARHNGADKYQVRVAANKKMTAGLKSKTVKGGKLSACVTKLKKGKTYYVQLRAYDSQTKSWGSWGARSKVRVTR